MGLKLETTLGQAREALARTIALATDVLTSVKHKPDDHFAFMGALFLAKQIGHAEALLILNDHQDTQLIARSMLEGLCLLYWARRETPGRPLRWRLYSYVLDWRRLTGMDKAGEPVETERRASIEAALAEHGHLFLSPAGKRRPDDPYAYDWTGTSLRRIFSEVNSLGLYDKSYHGLSAWHHWSPDGLGPALSHTDGVTTLGTRSVGAARSATSHAAGCLYDISFLVDLHLSLGFADRLSELAASFKELHEERPPQGA